MSSPIRVQSGTARITNALKCRGARARPTSILRRACRLAALSILAFALGLTDVAAQRTQDSNDQGVFLVARRGLSDPLFEESVVVMLPKDEGPLVVGLIVNKPSHIQVRDLFPKSKAPQKEDATAYFGGPVEVGTRSAIFRSTTQPKNAIPVFGDIYVAFESSAVAALAEDSQHASTVRVFLGRSQWSTEQLQNEMAHQAWYTLRGDADLIFTSHPEAAWRTLLKKLEPQPLVEYQPPWDPIPSGGTKLHFAVRDAASCISAAPFPGG